MWKKRWKEISVDASVFGRKRQRRPFTVSLQMWEMAALRWVGVNRSVLVSLFLSTSTSFPSCLAAAKTHKPVLTEANYSSLHLLQTGWNSSGIQHLGTQRHLHSSALLHIKTNWFTIKTHWALDNSSKIMKPCDVKTYQRLPMVTFTEEAQTN